MENNQFNVRFRLLNSLGSNSSCVQFNAFRKNIQIEFITDQRYYVI